MTPDPIPRQSLRSSLDRLAGIGDRHLRGCGIPAGRRTRAASLALYDRQLQLHDRLVTADEFLNGARMDGFVEAAIEDVRRFVTGAEQIELERIELEKRTRDRRLKWATAVAIACLLVATLSWLLYRGVTPTPDAARPTALSVAQDSEGGSSRNVDTRTRDGASREDPPAPDKTDRSHATSPSSAVPPERADLSSSEAGLSKRGEAAAAKPSQSSSSSSGSPSDQASPGEGESEESGSGKSRHASSDAAGSEGTPKSERQPQTNGLSGSDADKDDGANQQQAAGANNRSSVPNAPSSAQSSSEESQKGDQKGSSGSPGQQPSQKSEQKGAAQGQSANPGASNNASQGKGQGASKDALKKSRGVASMILGVPIADRVRGLPNPGLVRTTQKKIAPREDAAGAVDAENRGERQSPIGPVEHPSLRPWQKDLVRDYFSQDSSNEGKP